MSKEFDPENIRKSDMIRFADSLEEYLGEFTGVMIIPEDIDDKLKDNFSNGISVVEKLIKKLRKGDKSVFKSPDEWNTLPD